MASKIFVNLPVRDLSRAIAFYKALGFSQNLDFSDDTAACMVISEQNYVMLLTHERFTSFSDASIPDARTQTGLMVALERDSRKDVDATMEAALAAGGSEPRPPVDLGFMYNRTVSDPDGHRWEPFFMDMSQAPKQ